MTDRRFLLHAETNDAAAVQEYSKDVSRLTAEGYDIEHHSTSDKYITTIFVKREKDYSLLVLVGGFLLASILSSIMDDSGFSTTKIVLNVLWVLALCANAVVNAIRKIS
jgi:hypothetical protein